MSAVDFGADFATARSGTMRFAVEVLLGIAIVSALELVIFCAAMRGFQ